jgi:TrmH family RNA methyltransferase
MRVVLVRPRDPNNIGAAARALANFGLGELAVVAPHPPVWEEVRSAVGAGEVLARARVVPRLEDAVADCVLIGGTTAGTRRRLAGAVGPDEFFSGARGAGPDVWAGTAIVFGNEKTGLARAELDRCHAVVRIPTSPAQPSLNLGHAVAICCYEAARAASASPAGGAGRRERRATSAEVDALLAALAGGPLATAPAGRAAAATARLRRLLLRGGATSADVALLRGLLAPGRRVR